MKKNKFLNGIIDGLPICFGYLSVAFAFGIFAVRNGLSAMQAILISMTNVTSAGQLAAVPIIAGGGTLIELAVSQLVINLRYSLMSVSLSQKMKKSVGFLDKIVIAFVNTDEVFAVASGQNGKVGKSYLYGLIITPYLGWSIGTVIGAVAGDVLPSAIISALGIAIYAMFVAIVVPPMKKSKPILLCIIVAVLLSCFFRYIINGVPSGFAIIICSVVSSAVVAWISPVEEEEDNE